MTLEEALAKVGIFESKVTALEGEKLNFQNQISGLTEQVTTLTAENTKLLTENKEYSNKLETQRQELFLSEETEFCNRLVNEMKLPPAEKEAEIEMLVFLRNTEDKKYSDYRTRLSARLPLESLREDIQNKQDPNPPTDFKYEGLDESKPEDREKLSLEVIRRMELNKTDYATELKLIREGK